MDFFLYFCTLIVGGLLVIISTTAATHYVGAWAYLGTLIGLAALYAVVSSFVDLRIVSPEATNRADESQRKARRAIERAESECRDEWGVRGEILWVRWNNPDFPARIALNDEQYIGIIQEMAAVMSWCDANTIAVRRFSWSRYADQYNERLKVVLADYDPTKNYSSTAMNSYYNRLEEIQYMSPRPHFAFRDENDAMFFKMRWL